MINRDAVLVVHRGARYDDDVVTDAALKLAFDRTRNTR